MSKSRFTFPSDLARGGIAPISAAVRWGDLLFLSGFVPVDPSTRKVNGLDIDSQAEAVLVQIREAVENAGSDLKHVLKLECFLADPSDFAGWNRVFAKYFPEEPPARITQLGAFVEEGVRIQVHGIAAIPEPTEERS